MARKRVRKLGASPWLWWTLENLKKAVKRLQQGDIGLKEESMY